MNKLFLLGLLFFVFTYVSSALERSFSYLQSPQQLEFGEHRFGVIHRFFGDMGSTQSLGMYDGANFAIDTWISITDLRRFSFVYNTLNSEMFFGLHQHLLTYKSFYNAFQVDYFMYDYNSDSYAGLMFNYFIQYSNPDYKVIPILNYFYNTESELSNIALGFEYAFSKQLFFQFEYILTNRSVSDDSTYCYGIKFSALGLNYYVNVQNSRQTGLHQALNGIDDTGDTYLGIKVDRILNFKDFRKKSEYHQDYDRFLQDVLD